jgi:hypothetical protein
MQSETRLGSIECGEKADNTYASTYRAVKSFNFWWMNHTFNMHRDPQLYKLRFAYADMVDGFQALCACSHEQRNILLTFWVCKMVKRNLRADEAEGDPVLGSTKVTYLNSIQRALKMYEKQNHLVELYGADWSWRNSTYYSQLRGALDRETIKNEMDLHPSKSDRSVDFLSEEQFFALIEEIWTLSEDRILPFYKRLTYKVWFFVLGVISFGCLCARDEIAFCLVKEFEVLSPDTICFEMKRPFKSHKLTANKKITRKPSRLLYGKRYNTCLQLLLSRRNPDINQDRLFLTPLKTISEESEIWWSCEPMGKNTIGSITQKATQLLQKANHPLFSSDDRFTNSSLRKYHSDRLMEANAPLIHQQASLAQNVRAYTDKRKQKKEQSEPTLLKIAHIVAGERNNWHSPDKENFIPSVPVSDNSMRKSLPLKKRIIDQAKTISEVNPTDASKKMCFSFSNGSSNFSFSVDL